MSYSHWWEEKYSNPLVFFCFLCIPDDQTRVCLAPTTSEYESDYINASFIKVLQRFNFLSRALCTFSMTGKIICDQKSIRTLRIKSLLVQFFPGIFKNIVIFCNHFFLTRELLRTGCISPPRALWAVLWLISGVWFGNTMLKWAVQILNYRLLL